LAKKGQKGALLRVMVIVECSGKKYYTGNAIMQVLLRPIARKYEDKRTKRKTEVNDDRSSFKKRIERLY